MLSIGVYTFDLSGSPLWVAALMVSRMLPMVLFGSIFGAYADQFNRDTLLLAGLSVMTCVAVVLATLALGGYLELWHIALGAFLSGTYFSTDFSVRRTMLGEIASEDYAGTAMSLDSATNNATRAMGPLLGGLVYQSIGLAGAYVVGSCAYLVCFVLAARVVYHQTRLPPSSKVLEQLLEGLRYVRRSRRILGTLLVTAIVNLFGFPFATMVPVIGRDDLGLAAVWVGLLASAEGTGAFAGALVIAWFARARHYGRLYTGGSMVFLVAILLFSFSSVFPLAWSILLCGGLGIAGFAAMQSAILLTSAAPEYRSRTMGALAVCIGAGPIGVLHIGLLAEWLGARSAITLISLEGFLAFALTLPLWRPLWRATPANELTQPGG